MIKELVFSLIEHENPEFKSAAESWNQRYPDHRSFIPLCNYKITLKSTHESLLFYDKFCFDLSDPNQHHAMHPLVPLFQDAVKLIQSFDFTAEYPYGSSEFFFKEETEGWPSKSALKSIEFRMR